MIKIVVSDTGPLISLKKITGGYAFIRKIYDQIIVSPSVLEEVAYGYKNHEAYLATHQVGDLIFVKEPNTAFLELPDLARLHQGETEALQLASELKLPLLIEEKTGREIAYKAGIAISGIAGQILKAVHLKLLSAKAAKTMLLEMLMMHRISKKLYEQLIIKIDENN